MNKACIIGNLTKDPELRSTTSGTSVCSFTVAVNRRKRDSEGNELPPMYYRVTTWRQLAENCGKFLHKGAKVYVDGDLSTSTYQANTGETRFSLEIDAGIVEFLYLKSEGEGQKAQATPQPAQKEHQMGFTEVQVPEDELPF